MDVTQGKTNKNQKGDQGAVVTTDLTNPMQQGAATAADLLQDRPNQGAVETTDLNPSMQQRVATATDLTQVNPSAETSEEDKLAGSVDKMGLTTKRLSGAQRRKLNRAKKIAEGTWKAQKPRQAPQSKAKSELVGAKRPRSESTTPKGRDTKKLRPEGHKKSQAPTEPKQPRRHEGKTGSYSSVAEGFKMAVVHKQHPDITLDQGQADLVQEKLLEAVDNVQSADTAPQFVGAKFVCGILMVTCANEATKNWLINTVENWKPLWEGAELVVTSHADLPRRPKFTVYVPSTADVELVRSRLSKQNAGLRTTDWLVLSRKLQERGQTIAFSVDQRSARLLEGWGLKAYCGMDRVTFHPLGTSTQTSQDGAEAGPSKPAT